MTGSFKENIVVVPLIYSFAVPQHWWLPLGHIIRSDNLPIFCSDLDCGKSKAILEDCMEKSEFHTDYVSEIAEIAIDNNQDICRPVGMTPLWGPAVIVVEPITSI